MGRPSLFDNRSKSIAMTADENWNIIFSLNDQRNTWFLERLRTDVGPRMTSRQTKRILDLGCGCGDGTFFLAALFPEAQVVGLDISEANITHAQRESQVRQMHRVSFACGDYAQVRFPGQHFDLIVADSVLHFIPDEAHEVWPKIVRDLAPGGHLVFSIPDDSLFNRLLWLVRFSLRQFRSSMTDRLILGVAKIVHGKGASDEFLRERINYMYITPSVWFSKSFRNELCRKLGLVNVREQRYPHSSPGQFLHRLCIFSKPVTATSAATIRVA